MDYLSGTLPDSALWRTFLPIETLKYAGFGKLAYRHMYRDTESGTVFLTDGSNPDMGVHVQMGGNALEFFRANHNFTDAQIAALFLKHARKVSRCDLAIDLHGGELRPSHMQQMQQDGRMKTRSRTFEYRDKTENGKRGETFYIGSRQSRKYFRGYDKNAEQDIVSDVNWLRLELECKDMLAGAIADKVSKYGSAPVAAMAISNVVMFDHPEYIEAITTELTGMPTIPRKPTKTEKWLLKTVSRTLANCVMANPSFMGDFVKRVQEELTRANEGDNSTNLTDG